MNGYAARLAAFADGRRLLRLRHPVQNEEAVACDACGSVEPRWLHLLKDEATGRYALVGSNYVRGLTDLGVVRRRYAADFAEQAYARELAQRQADQASAEEVHQSPAPELPLPISLAAARRGAWRATGGGGGGVAAGGVDNTSPDAAARR